MEEYFWRVSKDHYGGKKLEDMFPQNHYQVIITFNKPNRQ